MAFKELKPVAIANIALVEIETYDSPTPLQYRIKTGEEISCKPIVSEGKEDILRSFNTIIAQNKLEDLIIGYELGLKEVAMSPELYALIDGGTNVFDENDGAFKSYEGAQVGTVTNRKLIKIGVYCEEKDANGETIGYIKYTFEYGKGKPAEFSFKNGEWVTPQYTIKTAAKIGQKPIKIEKLTAMPA